jgi:hypothetical protein
MLARAKKILTLIEQELSKRDRFIEIDDALTEVKIIVRFDQKTGEPGRVSYSASSERNVRGE